MAWQAWFGSVGCIWVWFGAVRFGRQGKVRSGRAGFGEVRLGAVRQVRHGKVGLDKTGFGQVCTAGKLRKEKL